MSAEVFLNFATRNQLYLIPISGKKPAVAGDWRALASRNLLDWEKWINEGFSLAVYAAKSRLFIADVDVKHVGRETAWPIWHKMANELGINSLAPTVHTPSGGFHYWLRLPVDPPAFKGVHKFLDNEGREFVGIRHAAYAVAFGPGYTFVETDLQNASPELVEQMRAPRHRVAKLDDAPKANEWNAADTERMIKFVAEQNGWAAREDWLNLGMGLRLAFGEAGRALWWMSNNGSMKPADDHQFESFKSEWEEGCVTLATSVRLAKSLGWQKSAAQMFGALSVQPPFVGAGKAVTLARPEWHHFCLADANGNIIPNVANAIIAVKTNLPNLAFDQMQSAMVWRDGAAVKDEDLIAVQDWI